MNRWFCVLTLMVAVVAHATTIDNARLWPAPDNTRLVFDLDQPAAHSILILKNPYRVVLDVRESRLTANLSDLDLNDSGISGIRSAVRGASDLRIVLDMAENMTPRSFALPPNEQYGHRLVLDLERPPTFGADAQPQAAPTVTKSIDQLNSQRRDIIVVIDAGHGGEDPGAVGPTRLLEKNVVLAIAKETYRQINLIDGYKAILVRDGDYIVSLEKRRNIARESNADLFVSIHADSFHNASANGASVFALSQGGSVSAVARYLADQENAADVIGGINGVPLDGKDSTLVSVLVDMSMTSTVQRSLSVGAIVLNEMGKFARLHGNKRKVEQANFSVLRAPDVPSILVETGFISNPTEEKNLGSAAYRKQMATAIRTGIVQYFEQNPPEGSLVANRQQQRAVTRRYTVASGDTLSAIAVRNGVSVVELKFLNNLNGNTIRIGQVLLIPGA